MKDKYIETINSVKTCQNKCMFCFIDQLPSGLRKELYIKDDDFRYSYMQGNFITLTNCKEEELEYIVRMHMSPLYVSVHATIPELRRKMLANKDAGKILEQLLFLTKNGIQIHTQIVVCKNQNDGKMLEKSLHDLYSLGENILSVGVVPSGLTSFRNGLFNLDSLSKKDKQNIISVVNLFRTRAAKERSSSWVFAADELYLSCDYEIPGDNYYEDYCQIENGIGLVRKFRDGFFSVKLPDTISADIVIVSGVSGKKALKPIFSCLDKNFSIRYCICKNNFLGGNVNVSALLAYSDVVCELKKMPLSADTKIFLPSDVLNASKKFIDGPSLNDLKKQTGCDIVYCKTGRSFALKLKRLDSEKRKICRK